jgi:hypothetical protein
MKMNASAEPEKQSQYKPNTNPIQSQNKANSQNVQNERKLTYNKGLQKNDAFAVQKNKPNSNPIKPNL